MKTNILIMMAGALLARAGAQVILFDFENAPIHTSLPLNLTVGGITARLSATGQGFLTSLQGNCPSHMREER